MRILIFCIFLLLANGFVCRGNNPPLQIPATLRTNSTFQKLIFVPPTYRKEALRLMIADANRTARQLKLPENLPITRTDLVGFHVSPPRLTRFTKTIGTVSTSNYLYAPFDGRGFVVVRRDLEQQESQLRAKYLWPTNRMNKKAAYRDATQMLRKAGMAVKVLNENCHVRIMTCVPQGQITRFVPIYWVTWSQKKPGRLSGGASVELFEPAKMILQLQAFGARYILRKPIVVSNTDVMLSQTNILGRTNGPSFEK